MLEYIEGVRSLTTNRLKAFDEAIPRVSTAIRQPGKACQREHKVLHSAKSILFNRYQAEGSKDLGGENLEWPTGM